MKNLFLVLIISQIIICCKEKNKIENRNGIFVNNVEVLLNREIPQLQTEHNVPAVGIALIDNGKIKLLKVYGEHQLGTSAPENTIFNVASITKTITTMTVLRLVSQGQWTLDEPLYNYWIDSDIIDDSLHTKITSRHALTHSIGFNNWRRMNESGKLEIDFEPGTRYQYSGEGMEYLKMAVEKKFDTDFGAFVDSLLFQSLGMKDATLNWIPEKDTVRFAKWFNGKGEEHAVNDYSTPETSAADDLLTTVKDLAIFGIAVMDLTIIDTELYEEMVKPQMFIHQNAHQGLGWKIVQNLPDDNYILNHDGGDIGVATTLILLPNTKSGIIVLTNGDNGRIICNSIVKKTISFGNKVIQKLYWGGEIPEIITVDPNIIKKYSGTYQTNQGTQLSFWVKENALKLEGEGIPGVEIYPKSDHEFFPSDFEVFFNFQENGDEVTFQLLIQGENTLEGTKIE